MRKRGVGDFVFLPFLMVKVLEMFHPHKNSQKRIYGDYIYFITCNIQDRRDYFRERIFCDLWLEELKLTKQLKRFSLFAFCLNYDHFHLLIEPKNDIANYSKVMQYFKRHVSRNMNIILGHNSRDLQKMSIKHVPEGEISPEGDIRQCRLRGNEFDKSVLKYREKYIEKHGRILCQPKFQWQKSFHDHIIRTQKDFEQHWNYTMYNFVKHNLPEDWQYTGLNFPDLIDELMVSKPSV